MNGRKTVLKDGTKAKLESKLRYDGFYNDATAAEEDGSGQKLLHITVSVDGKWIGSATAGYLAESHGGHLSVLNIAVDEGWRRRGVATIIYDAIEEHYGDQVLPYPGNEGGAIQHFWHHRLKDMPDLLDRFQENIGRLPSSNGPKL